MTFIHEGRTVYAVLPDGSRTLWAVADGVMLAEIITVALQERWNRITDGS